MDEIRNPSPDYRITIEKADGYEFSEASLDAIRNLAETLAREESEVAGFAFGSTLAVGDPLGFKLGPIEIDICGCDGSKERSCRCNGAGGFTKSVVAL